MQDLHQSMQKYYLCVEFCKTGIQTKSPDCQRAQPQSDLDGEENPSFLPSKNMLA
jgi:hypothetical protein